MNRPFRVTADPESNHHTGPIKGEHAIKSMELLAKDGMLAFA